MARVKYPVIHCPVCGMCVSVVEERVSAVLTDRCPGCGAVLSTALMGDPVIDTLRAAGIAVLVTTDFCRTDRRDDG